MKDDDYIRKGAELAGWLECDDEGEYLQIPAQPFSAYLDEISAACEQYLLDALAAELVRQVDALYGYDISIHSGYADLESDNGVLGWQTVRMVEGPDRIMNTIKCIVDSGVLL